MGRGRKLGGARLLLVPFVLSVAGCPDAGDRPSTERGTVGEEVYGIFCDRIGAQSLTEDLDGSSYRSLCHKNADGKYDDIVDESKLPAIDGTVRAVDGGTVDLDDVKARRARHIGRLKALVRRRPDIIRALDAAFPDITLPSFANVTDRDPTKTCLQVDPKSAPKQAKLTTQLTDMLGRIQALYNDGTLPRTTEALGRLMGDLEASSEGRDALTRLGSRVGYRPSADQLGLVRPAVAYGRLRDLSNAALSLLSADSQPYAPNPPRDGAGHRIPVPGPAQPAFSKLLETGHEELRTYSPDTPTGILGITADPLLGTSVLSRPRSNLELLTRLTYATDPAFATAGAPTLHVVLRDDRGYAVPRATTPGQVPAPFVDDGTGRPKLDDLGRFALADGTQAPAPFDVPFAPDLADLPVVERDAEGRALGADGKLVYDYIDTSSTFASSLLDNLRPLIRVNQDDPTKSEDALLDALAGLEVLSGSRDAGNDTTKAYAPDPKKIDDWKLTHDTPPPASIGTDPAVVNYKSFHADDARLVDFTYAVSNVLATNDAQATLALIRKLGVEHEGDLARLIGEALRIKSVSDAHPDAVLPRTSALWDDILEVVVAIAREPGMLEEVLQVLGDPTFLENGPMFAALTANRDLISYDRSNLNGPIRNLTTNNVGEDPKTPVDRSQPDTGDNRSDLQRFAQLVHDTDGVTACNKENAILYAVLPNVVAGQPAGILFPADFTYAANGAGTGGYKTCEFLKVDNLAKFYLESIMGKSKIVLRQSDVKNGTASRAYLSPKNTDPATQKEGDYCGFDVAPASLIGNLCLPTQTCCLFPNIVNFSQPADETLFATVTGIKGFWTNDKSFAVKPEFLSRFAFFDFDKDQQNPVTKTTLLRINGKNIGSRACTEKVFKDPCAAGSGAPHQSLCASTPDIASDGMVHGYYECANDADNLRGRDDNTLFLGEVLGFQAKIKPLLQIFVNRDKTQLFINLMEALNNHYSTTTSGISRYEPILTDLFLGDLLSGLAAFEKTLTGVTVPRCTAFDATTKLCTATTNVDGITLLANTTRDLVLPERAKARGLVNRDGSITAKRADGSTKPQTSSLDQLTGALTAFDDAFDAFAKAHPEDAGRQAQWHRARSRLVDQFLSVTGTTTAAKFTNRATPSVLPLVLDVLREELDANCPGSSAPPFPTCDWAKTGLTKKLTDVTTGPLFATALDVLDAIRNDPKARTETELLLLYLMDPTSPNDARASTQTMLIDLLQLLRDDTTLTPILHTFAGAADASLVDTKGATVRTSLIDSTTALLARLQGRAFDTNGVEICSKEIDPNQVLTLSLQNLVKPFPVDPLDPSKPTQTPLELLIDTIAEINRTDPGQTTKMQNGDYLSVAENVESFLVDKQRGLEQFYEVIRLGTRGQGD